MRLEAGLTNLYAYVHDVNAWIDPWGLAGTGGAYMFGFASGHKYIGKGEIGRMNKSIGERSFRVTKMNSTLIGAAHVSTGGNNTLGKMVEYKAMCDAGFAPGSGGIPAEYLNSYLSGKSAWVANPELQVEATKLAKQLRNDYEADVRLRANNKHS